MAIQATTAGLLALCNATIDWANDAAYAVLLNGYTFSNAHAAYSDLSGNELAGGGDYSPLIIASKTVAVVGGAVRFDCADFNFGDPVSIGPSDGVAILIGNGASPQASDLLMFFEDLSDLQSVNSEFVLNSPNGLYEIAVN